MDKVSGKSKIYAVIFVVSLIAVILGALLWGWIGLSGSNPISAFNAATIDNAWVERTFYVLVGLAGVVLVGATVFGLSQREQLMKDAEIMYSN